MPRRYLRNNGACEDIAADFAASGERMGERQHRYRPVLITGSGYCCRFLSPGNEMFIEVSVDIFIHLSPTYDGPPVYNLWVRGSPLNLLPSSSSPGLLYILITTPESSEAIYFLFTVAEKHFSRAWSENVLIVTSFWWKGAGEAMQISRFNAI